MRVDLHVHTWISDGDVSPSDVVRLASAGGLGAVAITDHDTVGGVREALSAAATLPIDVIPGIEISTRWDAHELHILGYWIDPQAPTILEHQERAVRRRFDRMEAMLDRLRALGVPISLADVELAAGPSVHSLGRPHLARALQARGHTRFYGEAFVRYIGDNGPAFVGTGFPPPAEAIASIKAAGGVAVWAHPPLGWFTEGLPRMVEWGIDGVECYRPGVDPGDLSMLEEGTRAFGLIPTGGSDWHGPHRAALGDFAVQGHRVRQLLALGGITV